MKGLFVKDLRILGMQKKNLLLLAIVALVIGGSFEDPITFIIPYMGMMAAMLACGTVSYDEFDHGYSFIFTLPVTRKEYVREKYLFGLFSVVVGSALALLISYAFALVKGGEAWAGLQENLLISAAFMALYLIVVALMLLLRLKYGSESARMVMVAMAAIFAVIIYAVQKFAGGPVRERIWRFFAPVADWSGLQVALALLGVSCVILFIVEKAAEHIMMKKEF